MSDEIINVEVVMKTRTPDGTTRPLYVVVSGAGSARAVAGAFDIEFMFSPPPTANENVWVMLARIASDGARAQAEKFG